MPYVFNPLTSSLDFYEAQSGTVPSHKTTHSTGGTDALSPSDIGAADASHTHSISEVTNLQTNLDTKVDKVYPLVRLGNYASGIPQLPLDSYTLPSGYQHSTIEIYVPQRPNVIGGPPCGLPNNYTTYTITIPEEPLNISNFKTPSNRLFIRIRNDWTSLQTLPNNCGYCDPVSRAINVVSGSKTLFSAASSVTSGTTQTALTHSFTLKATINGWVLDVDKDDLDKKADAFPETRTGFFDWAGTFPSSNIATLTSGRFVLYNNFSYNGSSSILKIYLPNSGTFPGDRCFFSFTPHSQVTSTTIYRAASSIGGGPWAVVDTISGNSPISDGYLCTGYDVFGYPVWTNINTLQGAAKANHTHSQYALTTHTHTLSEIGAEARCVYGTTQVIYPNAQEYRVTLNEILGRRVYVKIENRLKSGQTPGQPIPGGVTTYDVFPARLPTLTAGQISTVTGNLQAGDIYYVHIWIANNVLFNVQSFNPSTSTYTNLIRMRHGDVTAFEFDGTTWSILRVMSPNLTPRQSAVTFFPNGPTFFPTPPLSSSETGVPGQTYNDGTYFYSVGPDNVWKRTLLSSF
ncbi:MAG: hypothetical protein EBU96_01235 [Actinobacteria bacterium]|nr:hypothetical protein [Actinomycetota bacterium]